MSTLPETPRPRRFRSRVSWIAAALCALLIASYFGSRTCRGGAESAPPDPREGVANAALHEAIVTPDVNVDAPPRSDAVPAPVAATPTAARLRGRVVDATFGVPLVARVEHGAAHVVFTDASRGAFDLPDENAETPLRVSAAGYTSTARSLAEPREAGEIVIALSAARRATLWVQDEHGSPVPAARVYWRAAIDAPERRQVGDWIESSGHGSGTLFENETDAAGRAQAACSVPALATVRHPRSEVERTLSVIPGDEVVVVLPENALRLRVVAGRTRAPVAGLELVSWCPSEVRARTSTSRTDAEGIARFAPSSSPLLVRTPGAKVWQWELVPRSPGVARCGFGTEFQTMLRIDAIGAGEPLEVELRACGSRVALVDAETGAPIDARVRVRRWSASACGAADAEKITNCTALSPRSDLGSPDEVYRSTGGILECPCLLGPPSGNASGPPVEIEVLLTVEGYFPRVARIPDRRSSADAEPLTIALTRAQQRTLVVARSDGTPVDVAVAIHSPKGDVLCLRERGRSSGAYGPFDWFGGDLRVELNGKWSHRLLAAELARSAVVHLTLDIEPGNILLTGVPNDVALSTLVAKRGLSIQGVEYTPRSVDARGVLFDGLPPGTYLLGPRDWVLGAELQSIDLRETGEETPRPVRCDVRGGETTTLRWNAAWAAASEVEGRVRVFGQAAIEPVLFPFYAPEEASLVTAAGYPATHILGRRSPRLPLDRDGVYRIEAGAALPKLIVVCATSETSWGDVNGLRLLDVIAPGESADLRTAAIELEWDGAVAPKSVDVQYSVPTESLRHALFTFHSRFRQRWEPPAKFWLDGLPCGVREIVVGPHHWPLALAAGKITHLRVGAAPPPPAETPR